MQRSETIGLYDSLLASADAARTNDLYEVAFHSLAGALHAAEALEDLDRVHDVERRAAAIQEWLARNQPNHRIAVESAQRRGQNDVFTTLVVHAQSLASRLRAARVIDRARAQTKVQETGPNWGARREKDSSAPEDGSTSYVSE